MDGPESNPRWTRSAKDAVGTAYSTASRVWFTVSSGIVNEVYFPTIDRPQIRDLQFLITDGKTFFHDERRHLDSTTEYLATNALGFRITNSDREGRYRIVKELICDPHESCLLLRARLEADPSWLAKLHLFVLLAPHIEVGGWGNNGNVAVIAGREILTAHKRGTWLALAATLPFVRRSCGYVGVSDGWQDLAGNFEMDWKFEAAANGNIALCGELGLSRGREFTVGLAFGHGLPAGGVNAVPGPRRSLCRTSRPIHRPVEPGLSQAPAAGSDGRRRRRALSRQPQFASGPRGQGLSRSDHRLAQHPLGRS